MELQTTKSEVRAPRAPSTIPCHDPATLEPLRAMTNIKSVLEDRFPIHRPVKLYPVQPCDYRRTRATLEILYRRSLLARLRGVVDLASQLVRR
jgi:hypothetical protein